MMGSISELNRNRTRVLWGLNRRRKLREAGESTIRQLSVSGSCDRRGRMCLGWCLEVRRKAEMGSELVWGYTATAGCRRGNAANDSEAGHS